MLHLTVRVAWHDRAWDGAVCDHPVGNAFCLALDRVRESRDDAYEEAIAGRHWADLDGDALPPCRQEAGAFMSAREWTRVIPHPYQERSKTRDTHGHLRPTVVKVPPFSTFAVPFAWMTRRGQEEIANRLPNGLPEDREPPFPTAWVFGRQRQEALLKTFFDPVIPGKSLVFFYTKEGQPISDAINRLVVGVGRLTKVGPVLEYDSVGGKPTYPMWDRLVHHSIRPDGIDGFLLPYHAYLAPTGDPDENARRLEFLREIAVVPEPGHTREFSYFSERASADIALSTLVRCLDSVRRIRGHGIAEGPWELREEWLNEQIAQTWIDRGAFPGLGAALEALGMRLGMALALELIGGSHVAANADPWPFVDAMLRGEVNAPQRAYASDVDAVRATWAKLTEERRELLQLLSRFALSPDQARRWFEVARRNGATTEILSDREILENPYRIAESDLGTLDDPAVSVGVVDRGLFPDPTVSVNCPVPEQSRVESPADRRRVRGAAVSVLRRAADDGDSLLSEVEVLTRLERLDLARPCVVPLDWFPGNAEFLDPVVKQVEVEVPTAELGVTKQLAALQLASHADTELRLGRILLKRAGRDLPSVGAKWRNLLIEAIRRTGAQVDLDNPRHVDALEEQEEALERITTHRLGVLVGRAGTGKTSVLGALVRCKEIAEDGVLLLAPTGKARVRLQRATDHEASTIAQFLYRLRRYDGARQRVLFSGPESHRKEKTVVIDECSMLTMDDLYAVLRALDLGHVTRLILVGDPNQLPPIGVGRPFADLVGVLDEPSSEDEVVAAKVLARLTVEVRTALGGPSDALRLAAWFTNEPQPKDADRVLSQLELHEDFNDLEIVTWKTPEELRERIGEQLQNQLGLASPTDVAGFDRALGFTDQGWIPFDAPDGAEAFQILSPVRMHAHGVHDLNRWLQRRFRPRRAWAATMGDEEIGPKDKVIQLRNQKRGGWSPRGGSQEEYLANGEIGTVARYKKEGGWFDIVFAGRPGLTFGYRASNFGEEGGPLELAYALTVHKAQGSDFGTVFFILPQTRLLSRELLYTGLTRSKQKLVLLVEGDDISGLYDLTLPTKSETARRNTNLFRSVVREDAEETPYAEHLIHRLSDGRMVRSKSELAIAIELQRLGMWSRCDYERPLEGPMTGGRLRPDFTFIDPAGDPIIWEHLGMLGKESYRRSWGWKLEWYGQNGYRLGENLFTTEDDKSGGLDQTDITRVAQEIDNLL
jgi:ATP-dependent exoDNAse (exonuclease V) alpha subunit